MIRAILFPIIVMSPGELERLREAFVSAKREFEYWTSGGKCQPGSQTWEKTTARYHAARDAYDFASREASAVVQPALRAKEKAESLRSAFARYDIVKTLGEGGAGIVYEVVDHDGARWALETLRHTNLSQERLKRFKNEIAFCGRATHPNIIAVADWGLCIRDGDEVPFYVMPLMATTLRRLMRVGIAHDRIMGFYAQLLNGMRAAHEQGVWHRDLKPENILYDEDANRLVVADFGIAHFAQPLLRTSIETGARDRLANFQYAAPEQRTFGEVDHRADIYALGLILNEMFTGELLQGTGHRKISTVAAGYASLDDLVDRKVRQHPAQRPQSIEEVETAIGALGVRAAAGATAGPTSGQHTVPAPSSNAPRRERGEELYVLAEQYFNAPAGHYLPYLRVMEGELTYNQALNLTIKREDTTNLPRLELLIDVDFPDLRPALASVLTARNQANEILAAHKAAYKRGDTNGQKYIQPLRTVLLGELEPATAQFKRDAIAAIKAA